MVMLMDENGRSCVLVRGATKKIDPQRTAYLSVLLYCNQKRSSIQGLEYTFQHPETSYTHTSHTCRSLFLGPFEAARGVQDLAIHRDRHSGHAATATAHVRAHLATHASTEPPSVQNHGGGGENGPLDDGRIMRCEHGWPTQTRSQNDHPATSMRRPTTLASTAATRQTSQGTPKSWPHCCWPPCCCSHQMHQMQRMQPNPASIR